MGLFSRMAGAYLNFNQKAKNNSIIMVTSRMTAEVMSAMGNLMSKYPDMKLKDCLSGDYVSMNITIRDLRNNVVGYASGATVCKNYYFRRIQEDEDVCMMMDKIWSALREELKYDPTFGTEEDMYMCYMTAMTTIQKLSQ